MYYLNPIDEHGNKVLRTKQEHPYSYDGFVLWRGIEQGELTNTFYTDRLRNQHHDKWSDAQIKHFGSDGDYFESRNPHDIENFLIELTGKQDLKLGLIMEYCNVSNGYPVWRFDVVFGA